MDDTVYDGTSLPPTPAGDAQALSGVPTGSLEDRLSWVAAGETLDERSARADQVYAYEVDDGDTDLVGLGGSLTAAVYGTAQPGQEDAAPGTSGDEQTSGAAPAEQPGAVASAAPQEITGELVHTDAPAGAAVNAETGEVTAPGEQLPDLPDSAYSAGATKLEPVGQAPESTPPSTE